MGRFHGFTKSANGLEQFTLEEHSMRLRKQRPKLLKADVPIDRSCCFPNLHYLILLARLQVGTLCGFIVTFPMARLLILRNASKGRLIALLLDFTSVYWFA